MHSFSTFLSPVKAAEVAAQAARHGRPIGNYLAILTINLDSYPQVTICLSPGQKRENPSHFDVFGPRAILLSLVARVVPIDAFLS